MRLLVILLCVIAWVAAENPGLVGGLKLPIVDKIKAEYFNTFMEEFKNINIPEIKEGDLKISGIQVQAVNEDQNNVQVSFNEEKNGINVVVDNTNIKVHVNWKYEILIVKITGVGDISGPISHLNMLVGFETQEKEGFLVPKINIQDFDIGIDSNRWNFHFDCSACPPGIADLLLSLFKGQLVDKIKSEARSVVNNKIADIVNEKMLESYPTSVALNEDISVSLANTGVVTVKSDYMHVPLDATVFLSKDGYNRPFDAPEIPTYNPENPGEIQLYASTYLYETLEDTINKYPMQFETTLLGFPVYIDVDGNKEPIEFQTKEKNLHVLFGCHARIPGLKMEADISAETNIDVFFKPGDTSNMVYVDPDVNKDSLKLKKFKLTVFGFTIDLSIFSGIVNFALSFMLNKFMIPTIPIAKIEALRLTSTAATIDFHDAYTEAGLAFNFGLDH